MKATQRTKLKSDDEIITDNIIGGLLLTTTCEFTKNIIRQSIIWNNDQGIAILVHVEDREPITLNEGIDRMRGLVKQEVDKGE